MPIAPGYNANAEPPLSDVLNDPIVHLVLARDCLALTEVRTFLDEAGRHLRDRPGHQFMRGLIPTRSWPIAKPQFIR
jgi:hypothetical protein